MSLPYIQTDTAKWLKNQGPNLRYLSSFACDKCSERFGVEPGEGEAETAVHAVSCQLKRLLSDVILQMSKRLKVTDMVPPCTIIILCFSGMKIKVKKKHWKKLYNEGEGVGR